ncbi:MAG: shikimate kinase [Clostridiales bacterium]|nr:shikimate kinase [Clostridiales bacterium]
MMEGQSKNLILIGMMGCGKTTTGRRLSRMLGMPLVDTDQEIVRREGRSINDIFAQRGEDYFRALETETLRDLCARGGQIIATGGGLPLREENRALLRESGLIFFLNRSPEETFDDTDLADRPLAQQGREDFVRRYQRRLPVYRGVAHHEITGCNAPAEAARRIAAIWKEQTRT